MVGQNVLSNAQASAPVAQRLLHRKPMHGFWSFHHDSMRDVCSMIVKIIKDDLVANAQATERRAGAVGVMGLTYA